LIYTLEKLSELLALCTFKIPFIEKVKGTLPDGTLIEQEKEKRYPHSISYYDGIIKIKPKGFYQLFHDSYSNDSDIYTKESEFILEEMKKN
jgi:hypothetical protein